MFCPPNGTVEQLRPTRACHIVFAFFILHSDVKYDNIIVTTTSVVLTAIQQKKMSPSTTTEEWPILARL